MIKTRKRLMLDAFFIYVCVLQRSRSVKQHTLRHPSVKDASLRQHLFSWETNAAIGYQVNVNL